MIKRLLYRLKHLFCKCDVDEHTELRCGMVTIDRGDEE
jgi:hypothetical protein